MSKVDDLISKSLDEVEAVLQNFKENKENLAKSMEGEPNPEEVSENAPEEQSEGGDTPEEGEQAPEDEGAPEGESNSDEDTDSVENEDTDETEKSLQNELSKNDSVRKALEVSDFLTGLVAGLTEVMGKQSSQINKSISVATEQNEFLAKSFEGLATAQKVVLDVQAEVLKSLGEVTDRLNTLESQPVTRKSVSNVKVLEKSFKDSVGAGKGTNSKAGETLSKSEAVQILTNEFTNNNRADLANDIMALESVGNFDVLSQSAKMILNIK